MESQQQRDLLSSIATKAKVEKAEFIEELKLGLAKVKTKDKKEVDNWKVNNSDPTEGDRNVILHFTGFMWSNKFGDNLDRVEAVVLAV
eukprot:15366754-Ditylum_brightwellii.AAC.1